MDPKNIRHIFSSIGAAVLLLVALLLILHGSKSGALAAPLDRFVTPSGSGSDCTQANPCSLSYAVGQSVGGDTIYLAQGTYIGTGEAVITLTESVRLLGGWDGSTVTPPILDFEQYPSTLDGENTRRVVLIDGDIGPWLDGLIITGGNASAVTTSPNFGGGIYSFGADPILTHNVITANLAASNPGGWGYGGGICLEGSNGYPMPALIKGNVIAFNTANSVYVGNGGGMIIMGSSTVSITENIIQENIAGSSTNGLGGGIAIYSTSAQLKGNLIKDNQSTPSADGFGGGLYSEFGNITLDSNYFISNGSDYGTITFQYDEAITLTNNIIAQNIGGGVFMRGRQSDPMVGILTNNTFVQNGTEGIYAGWASSSDINLTLTNNIISGHTTGIYAYPDGNPNVVSATHTLFYDNQVDTDGATITSTHEVTGQDPRFLDLPGQNFHLQSDSPAIDAGTPVPWLTTDIDGDVRPLPTGGDYDIGADEAFLQTVYLPLLIKPSN